MRRVAILWAEAIELMYLKSEGQAGLQTEIWTHHPRIGSKIDTHSIAVFGPVILLTTVATVPDREIS
jgi:hypothetical protein